MIKIEDRYLIANACNLSGLYFLCKGIRIDQLDYSKKIIDTFNNGERYPTQELIFKNIIPIRRNYPILISNLLFSGCYNTISNIILGNKDNITRLDLLSGIIPTIINEDPPFCTTDNFKRICNNKELYNRVGMLLFDSYINLNRHQEISKSILDLLDTDNNTYNKICCNEIKVYSNNIITGDIKEDICFMHQLDLDSIVETNKVEQRSSLYYAKNPNIINDAYINRLINGD